MVPKFKWPDSIVKTNLKNYIKIFNKKFFTKPQCRLIINALNPSTRTTHTFYNSGENKTEKMGHDPYISFLFDQQVAPMGNLIKHQWHKIISAYIVDWLDKKEKIDWFTGWTSYAFPKFMEYNEGTVMKNHCDHIFSLFEDNGKPRGIPILSIITALNDDYSGGEIIMCQKYKYKLKTGETLIFPSNFLYPHEIKKITKGTRHSMVSWVY